jgi:hypothetical protein
MHFIRGQAMFHAADSLPDSSVPSGYHLTFDDEFESLSIADEDSSPARWYSQTIQCCMFDTSSPMTLTQMSGLSAPDGQRPFFLVPGQGLNIRLQKSNDQWYSGVLATVNRKGIGFAQRYGYFEMKARFPAAPGTWPAFWLLNQNSRTTASPPAEIDIVEAYMFAPDFVNITLHDWGKPPKTLAHKLSKVENLSKGFHTFGLLWTAETMQFFCDGKVIAKFPTPQQMEQPFFPIIDLGLGGGWPTRDTPSQSDLLIRYVRVYAPDV